MNGFYTFTSIPTSKEKGKTVLVEVASALNFDPWQWEVITEKIKEYKDIKLYCQFDPKPLGSGDVASNLRYKHNKTINNRVVGNTIKLFSLYSEITSGPIILTSYPREQRYKTVTFSEDGFVKVINNATKGEIDEDTQLMNKFLKKWITQENLIKMKESTKGARYNTYLADMISFILMMNHRYHPEMFDKIVRNPTVFNTTMMDADGQPYLKSFTKNGKEWIPKDFDYLYFEDYGAEGQEFMMPKKDSIGKIYHQLNQLISLEENVVKEMLRKFLSENSSYQRFSDYFVNDVDDYFTILMIKNAYEYISESELSMDEKLVKSEIMNISESVIH